VFEGTLTLAIFAGVAVEAEVRCGEMTWHGLLDREADLTPGVRPRCAPARMPALCCRRNKAMTGAPKLDTWQPPEGVSRDDTLCALRSVLAKQACPCAPDEDNFPHPHARARLDMGVMIYEPSDPRQIIRGADGNKVGVSCCTAVPATTSRWSQSPRCCREISCKAVAMTFQAGSISTSEPRLAGRHPSIPTARCVHQSGRRASASRAINMRGARHTMRLRYGPRTVARAKPGTIFL